MEAVSVGLRRSSNYSFNCPTKFSVEASRTISSLYKAPWEHGFPLLSCIMVQQNCLEANQMFFSMASPNFSHSWVFAFVTARVSVHFAFWYLPGISGNIRSNKVLWDVFFNSTVPFTFGVWYLLRRLPRWQASATSQPQLCTDTSTMEVQRVNQTCSWFFPSWKLLFHVSTSSFKRQKSDC